MRVLGIDFGDRNIGLSLSDRLRLTAQPLGTYVLGVEKENLKYFRDLISQHEVGEIVIGLPLRMDGSLGTRAQKTQEFASWMKKFLDIPITLWDERLTTVQAESILREQNIKGIRKKTLEHQVSATLILANYLEAKRNNGHDPQSH